MYVSTIKYDLNIGHSFFNLFLITNHNQCCVYNIINTINCEQFLSKYVSEIVIFCKSLSN